MGRVRTGAFSGVVFSCAIFAFNLTNCASATQIVVDVETDEVLCDTIVVGIAVGKPEEIDTKPISVRQAGCIVGGAQVGSLTITPSGDHNAAVGVRIVAGVNGTEPEACGRQDVNGNVSWQNCILARRTVQFAPGQTTPLTVVLSADCVGQICADGRECNLGKCVEPTKVQPDGGNEPVKDGGTPYIDAPSDTTFDTGPIDSGVDACVFCKGPPGNGTTATCDGVQNTCTVDCRDTDCRNAVVCSGGLNCTINCPQDDSCNQTRCDTTGTCSFNCNGPGGQHCRQIDCHAFQCSTICSGAELVCNGISVEAGASNISCAVAAGSKATCDDVSCTGGSCVRTCGPGGFGCGLAASCTGDCTNWADAGDGG